MSINPPSDIVLDVARAADPVNSRGAAEKLSQDNSTNQFAINDFDHALANANAMLQMPRDSYAADGKPAAEMLPRGDARRRAYKGLEQLVWKNLVENMLLKDSGIVFGNGTAGDIWRATLMLPDRSQCAVLEWPRKKIARVWHRWNLSICKCQPVQNLCFALRP